MKKTLWCTFVFLFICTIAQAQTLAVKGNVVSKSDGEPIVGASVVVNGNSTSGTITDIDGNFTLEVPQGSELTFSSLGFKSVTLKNKYINTGVLRECTVLYTYKLTFHTS